MLTKSLHDTVLDVLKVRATNYRLTMDEFDALFDYVYRDVTSTITTAKKDIEVVVEKDQPITIAQPTDWLLHSVVEATEKKSGDNVMMYFDFSVPLSPVLADDCVYLKNCGFFDIYGASPTVIFSCTASTLPDNIDKHILDLLVPVIVEGMLYNTESYIPSTTDAQVANISSQRYYTAKKQLQELLPQGI